MAASSSATADSRPPKYDVFISFRGKDTRKGFTSHLYSALSGKQIEAYIDEVSLEKGDTISRALPEAIKESEISIIIFSENYGESRWCLDELVHILKRREENDQIVLPIFYNIDPSHIRHQKETYAAAFVKHEERFEMEKVQKWRQALKKAADLSGWDSQNMLESKLVEELVERVRTELDSINSKRSGDYGFFGIPERVEKIKSFLDSPTVRTIGIWGMGGIGKTVLAKAVFGQFCYDFKGSYFAPNVSRYATENKGLDKLENKVYSKLLGKKKEDIFKSSVVNYRLRRKKILLVLDDVETPSQFDQLVRKLGQLCPGSKIIATSRHKLKVDAEYKVGGLDFKDACKLFYLHAFSDKSCRRGYTVISREVVKYTKGHPLALEALGLNVFYFLESIKDWEKELENLKRTPNGEVKVNLERSYNVLDAKEKGLFLDIACFFEGERRDFVEGIQEDKPITGLVNKSLITIEDGEIHMHYLIQVMGRDIVLQSTKKLGERSRLWIAEDVSYVLKNNKGTDAIEGIYLPLLKDEVGLTSNVFKEMRKLRLLKFYDASHCDKVKFNNGDLKCLPNSLKYLHWEYYPGKSLPSNFEPQYLVELHMPCSELEQLWDGVQEFGRLKHINLFKSRLLTKIPDLSRAPRLESINLSCCESLIHVPLLNLNLQATVNKSAYRHQWLSVAVDYSEFEAERTPGCIILNGCLGLETLPKVSGNIMKLVLRRTLMEELPSSIESLENLLLLDLSYCYKLKSLPKLPRNIEVLVLNFSGIEQIPSSSIDGLCSLRELSLSYCQSLSSLQFSTNLKALKELKIIETSIQKLSSTIGKLCMLKKLVIKKCRNLQSLPASIGKLCMLKKLVIKKCKNLFSLPELPLFIESVNVEDCSSLEMVSTSRSTLTPRGLWHDNYGSDNYCHRREFSFLNCTNFGEDAINNIFREFLYKVFCTATTPPEVAISKAERVIRELLVCYPTKQIPRWFNNQSEGSSMTITLSPNWYNPKTFLGFVVSVVVGEAEAEAVRDEDDWARFDCELSLMTNKDRFKVDVFGYMVKSCLDHIVMWYKYFDHSKANFEKYQEASLEFRSGYGIVKRCGVRLLYLKDALEDGTTSNFESWRTDVIDSDTDYTTTYDPDEPPPKRTRNL